MLRTSVLCCAMAGLFGLTVGCNPTAERAIKMRDDAVASLKPTFDGLEKKFGELKEKADKATGDEKARLETKWKESSDKRQLAKMKLDELKTATTDKWEMAKNQADSAVGEFKKAVE